MDRTVLVERMTAIGRLMALVALIIVVVLLFTKQMNWDLALILALLAAGIMLS